MSEERDPEILVCDFCEGPCPASEIVLVNDGDKMCAECQQRDDILLDEDDEPDGHA